ncbi:hypothetical protein PTTG_26558 [Puccinia triticina 1-1 BBBD Race 1]|uniref:Subtelomeric hrmA-associated cluster protein AFUB-079030/YDR124W-like helical bundle domain-containing protein n=2 Tax=Puccinia triticina TaxID=208348 RepID=A0A180GS85_PUCT1|nr:uncharacterized protein PtA15_14A155 [Puccinia triticina]OAV95696.1 hypothetical protein PTTG_26558 [Puccinia triticina 1-1 BBBD Race 1]WAQ91273.1 hypothetical protein PtA15_14A155 [Puccinia triticina]WAR62077.1 hypothetical protein PtB15_14B171 [Puccinia triticina]
MPRIPTRTTPYDTPTRQHRHFKNKRDQVLRALGRSCYINGSQFAIIWVSARGETETYASPALQSLLQPDPGHPGLFSPEILQRAKEAALKAPPELKVAEISLEHIRKPQSRADAPPAASPVGSDSRSTLSAKGAGSSSSPNQHDHGSPGTAEAELSIIESKVEGDQVNYMLQDDILCITSQTALPETSRLLEPLHEETITSESEDQERNENMMPIECRPIKPPTDSPTTVSFSSPLSIASFLENKFRQLQQSTCKLVCKAWIKVVEPKKQRKFPYRSGETSKPEWWPRGVVHREPDHLLKPDRIKLMLAVLGAGKVPVGRLELASAEMAAFIPPDKMDILRDIYTVAKEEERLRATWPVGVNFVPFQVELSNNLCEAPSKSSGSPHTKNSDMLTASPTTIHYLPNVQTASEPTISFLGTAPSDTHPHETWNPNMFPGCLGSIEPPSFTHEKSNGILPGEYNGYSWPTNSDFFHESMVATNQTKRWGRPGQNVLDNMESLSTGSQATSGYNFAPTLQSSFNSELMGSSMEKGSSKESTSTEDQPFFQEFSTPENSGWENGGMFFDNGIGIECAQNLWRNVTIPSTTFETSKIHSEESYLH